jgi:hypothetical protein
MTLAEWASLLGVESRAFQVRFAGLELSKFIMCKCERIIKKKMQKMQKLISGQNGKCVQILKKMHLLTLQLKHFE